MKSIRNTGRPRAVLASRIYAPESAAAAFRLRAIVLALVDAGIGTEVLTVAAPHQRPGTSRPRPGIRERRWPVKRDASGIVRGYVEYATFDVPLAVRELLTARPDVFICEPPPTTGLVTLCAARLRRIPFVYLVPDLWADGAESAGMSGGTVGFLTRIENLVLRRADLLLATSPELVDRAVARGASPTRVIEIGNGADDLVFYPDGPAESPDGPLFVHAGRMSEWQGCDVLIKAMPAVLECHPDAQLAFLGDGSMRPDLERLAAELAPGHVTFLGWISPEATARYLRAATAALATNTPGGYTYARTTKVYSAAACGAPVIYSGSGPCAYEVPRDGLGVTADFTPEAIAAAMIAAADSPATSAERARIARWTKENLSLSAVGRRAQAAITQLLQATASPAARPD